MEKVVERTKPVLNELSDYKENGRIRRTVSEILEKVKNALLLNPDFCPTGLIPIGENIADSGQPGFVSGAKETGANKEKKEKLDAGQKKKHKKKPIIKRLSPTAIIKKLKLGQQGVSCCIDHLGFDGAECHTDGTIIYINRDHPLYQKESQKKDAYELYIARLLTQEICLMKAPHSPRQAFQRQSKLLRDALIGKGKDGLNVSTAFTIDTKQSRNLNGPLA
jgi:hypothetical protein